MKFKIFILACLLSLSSLSYGQALDAPGFVTPDDYKNTCFDYMGAVDFTAAYRFKTDAVNASANQNRLYGFSIPLVGDLNGDGYPEIVGILGETTSTIAGKYQGIQIFNGQTGALISSINFPWLTPPYYYYHYGFHGAPSIMALVDSDRNGVIEIIFTIPSLGGIPADYQNDVVSCNIVYNSVSKTYSLAQRWRAIDYNTPAAAGYYEKPIPQVVDLDGDGTPELIVYNKVYNASTGDLLLTLETLGTDAFVGSDAGAISGSYDQNIGFSYVYDMDLDGIYDIVAGGKVYKITKQGGFFKSTVTKMANVPDGRTGVADINGDGIPDVVSVTRTNATYGNGTVQITVWNPGFLSVNSTTGKVEVNDIPAAAQILAQMSLPLGTNGTGQGNNSYVYIGDIDGREQVVGGVTYRLPEIAVLGGIFRYGSFVHPNVSGLNQIPVTGTSTSLSTGGSGVLAAVTWDAKETQPANRLKLSFILGHEDNSINTGFTMFDFDNDGMQEICYRDEQTLRIIKAANSYVKSNETVSTTPSVIKFSQPVKSFTGFEYPVIADIDNDASAEMIVMGHSGGNGLAWGNIYAVGNGTGDKFAPALPVWNQFMYDPFKINPDLTTPKGPARNRLLDKYTYTRIVKDGNAIVKKVIRDFLPYNGTLTQATRFTLNSQTLGTVTFDDVYEPIIFLTEAYIQDEDNPLTPAATNYEAPYIDVLNRKIIIHVGNRSTAETDVSPNTPITVYENSILPTLVGTSYTTRKTFTTTLSELGILSAIKAGEEVRVEIPFPAGYEENGFYIVRLGDASTNLGADVPNWSFGINKTTDTPIAGMDGVGLAQRAYRDCEWNDQTAKVSAFGPRDDTRTIMNLENIEIDVLANDYLPTSYTAGINAANITVQPIDGTLTFSNNKITYKHNGLATLPNGIDQFTYKITYIDPVTQSSVTKTAVAYIFILKSDVGNFAVCPGASYNLTLRDLPKGVVYKWYANATTTTEMVAPGTIPNVTADLTYYVEPRTSGSALPYKNLVFPRSKLTVKVVAQTGGANKLFKWTGAKSSNWNDPANWNEVNRTTQAETLATHAPSTCVDVIIPTVTTNYPVLSFGDVSQAGIVTFQDRGLLQNSYKLNYVYTTYDLTFDAQETNRWLLYSAPFSNLFSGDFTTKDASPKQNPRATYLSFYEAINPDNSAAAVAKTFTQPFGKVDKALTLGGAFMIYLDTKYDANPKLKIDKPYSFTNLTHSALGAIERNKGTVAGDHIPRFIYEAAPNYVSTTGAFSLSYPATSTYILAVNPYPAYLSLQDFLTTNTAVLDQSYKIWNGTPSDIFVTRTTGVVSTWKVSDTAVMDAATPTTYIAPYQAFFVKRKNSVSGAINILYNPTMTRVFIEAGGYRLK